MNFSSQEIAFQSEENGLSQTRIEVLQGTEEKPKSNSSIQMEQCLSTNSSPPPLLSYSQETPNKSSVQSEEVFPQTKTEVQENDQRLKSNSFVEFIQRIYSNSITPPIPGGWEDTNDSPVESPSQMNSSSKNKTKFIKQENLFQFVSLVILFYNQLVSNGICYSLGVLYVSIRDAFQATKAITALIISVSVAILGFGGVFAGMIVNHIGIQWSVIISSLLCSLGLFCCAFVSNIWYLFFTLGILNGLGASLMNVTTMISVCRIFNKNKNTIIMLLPIANPLGTFCLPMLMNLLLDFYSWRGTFIILSGLTLNMCFAVFLSTNSQQPKTEILQRPKSILKNLLHCKTFLVSLFSSTVSSSCSIMTIFLIVDFWVERGHSLSQSVSILSISSIMAIISRIIFGISNSFHDFSDYFYIPYYGLIILGGISIALIPLCTTFTQIIIVLPIVNILHGTMATIRPAFVLKTVGMDSYSVAYGLIYTCFGLTTAFFTLLGGKISDLTHSYNTSFYFAGILETVIGIISFLHHSWLQGNCQIYRRKKNKEENF